MCEMRLAALLVVCGLVLSQDGGEAATLQGADAAYRTPGTGSLVSGLHRRTPGDLLEEDPSLCLSLRENEEQRQLLCNDRRSKFNFNAFGLRFGKRYDGYIYRRAVKRARTDKFSPLSVFSRELEVPT